MCSCVVLVQWFNLDSMKKRPELVSDTYLRLFLAQLQLEGRAWGVGWGGRGGARVVVAMSTGVMRTGPGATSFTPAVCGLLPYLSPLLTTGPNKLSPPSTTI